MTARNALLARTLLLKVQRASTRHKQAQGERVIEGRRRLGTAGEKSRRVEKPFAKNELVLKTKGIAPIGSSMSLWPFFMNFRGP
jgi:hypothetical protein